MKPPTKPVKQAAAAETVALSSAEIAAYLKSKAHKKQLREQNKKNRSLQEAASAPLPGPLRDAFAAEPPNILGIVLQPVSAAHIAILTQIHNPFVEGIRYGILAGNAATKKEKDAYAKKATQIKDTVEDAVEVLYLFSLTPSEARLMLDRGRDAIRAAALELMDHRLPPIELGGLGGMLAAHYLASFSTQIQHRVAEDEKRQTINFPKPASPTDLAGSSKPSARS